MIQLAYLPSGVVIIVLQYVCCYTNVVANLTCIKARRADICLYFGHFDTVFSAPMVHTSRSCGWNPLYMLLMTFTGQTTTSINGVAAIPPHLHFFWVANFPVHRKPPKNKQKYLWKNINFGQKKNKTWQKVDCGCSNRAFKKRFRVLMGVYSSVK